MTRSSRSDTSDFRSCHLARGTPFCPEVHQNRNTRGLDNLVKQLCIDLDWLIDRRQGLMAGAASSGMCQVRSGNSVLAATALACANEGHRTPRSLYQL